MSVIAINSASRERALALLATDTGSVVASREMPGGELDRRLPGVLADLLPDDLGAVVVLTGPGSYSGVRAGMAAALGLAAARSVALHGMGSLMAVAVAANPADGGEFIVVADAGRGGVYVARFAAAPQVEQVSGVQRVRVDQLEVGGRIFGSADVAGLRVDRLDPVRVLAAAVPRALALPPLNLAGLAAVHAEPPPPPAQPAEESTEAL